MDTAPSPVRPAYALRDAREGDIPALAVLKRRTFRQTFVDDGFAIPYPAEDVARFEDAAYGEEKVRAELADPAHRTWVVEAPDGALVAYAHTGPCKLPHPEADPSHPELYQIYVDAAQQGTGLGRVLLDAALAHCASLGGPVWLGVWTGNARAQAVYRARGFVEKGVYAFHVGTWRDEDMMMQLPEGVPAA